MASPQVLSTGVFVTVLRMLVVMCASCPDLAVILLKQSKRFTSFFSMFFTAVALLQGFFYHVQIVLHHVASLLKNLVISFQLHL